MVAGQILKSASNVNRALKNFRALSNVVGLALVVALSIWHDQMPKPSVDPIGRHTRLVRVEIHVLLATKNSGTIAHVAAVSRSQASLRPLRICWRVYRWSVDLIKFAKELAMGASTGLDKKLDAL